jgi:hypothetical protein
MAPASKKSLFTVFADPTPSSSALLSPRAIASTLSSKSCFENKENVGPLIPFSAKTTPERKGKSSLSTKQRKKRTIQDNAARNQALWNGKRPFSEASPDIKQQPQPVPLVLPSPALRTTMETTKHARRVDDDVDVVGAPSGHKPLRGPRTDFRPNPNAAFFRGMFVSQFIYFS